MRNKAMKKLLILGMSVIVATSATGCGMIKPYDKPELVEIEASQTGFLIPLVGDTEDQASFKSEKLLAEAKVATKQIQIPHRWIKTGRLPGDGKWIASAKLIVVERSPEVREWNSEKSKGTSAQNQAIYAESKESIGFSVGMNCSAQVYSEDDAIKFLYSYNNKTLKEIMDSEIRATVESAFVETCARYSMNEILEKKDKIMTSIRDEVIPYFKERGITITNLGMKDGIQYDDPEIQKTINEKFSSAQKLVTQNNENEVTQSKAEAEAKAKITKAQAEAEVLEIKSMAEAEANKRIAESLTDNFVEYNKINNYTNKWNGELPKITSGDSSMIVDVGSVLEENEE